MKHAPTHNHDDLLTDEDVDSISDSDLGSRFESSDDEVDARSDTDSEDSLQRIGHNIDDDDELFEGEVRHPPSHYLTAAANLDVARLRQKRYSPRTQVQLDRVKQHHDL